MLPPIHIDVHPGKANRIIVEFDYNPAAVTFIKEIEGAKFTGKDRPHGPSWHVPLLLGVCHDLRTIFGQNLNVGQALKDWYRQETARQEAMLGHMEADDAALTVLPQVLPELADTLHPYQRAATVFSVHAHNTLIADQPGLGKTLETIATIYEGKTQGDTLVVAPKTSLNAVWRNEIAKWTPDPVFVMEGYKRERAETVREFFRTPAGEGGGRFLICNPEALRPRREKTGKWTAEGEPEFIEFPSFPEISRHTWDNIVIDECHKGAIRNPQTITAQALYALDGRRRIALSGTPMKNRPVDLWGTLHWLEPELYTSKWAYVNRYLETSKGYNNSTKIGGLRADRELEHQQLLAKHMIRRTKAEVLKELPPKQYVDLWCDMTKAQEKIYKEMERDARVRLQDTELTATNVLSIFLRLKQFAAARYKSSAIIDAPIEPTNESGKFDMMDELLDERDIYHNDWTPTGEKVVVFSQFSQLVKTAAFRAHDNGARVAIITGGFSGYITPAGMMEEAAREAVVANFQKDGGANVIFITTTAGGVAITLDRASTVIFLDEMWSPADMEQAEDRVHRASRMHQVTIYTLRSTGTIDEYIHALVKSKEETAKAVLDAWRSGTWELS